MALTGKNISLPIYYDDNGTRTSFHNLVLHKFTVDSVVMSLGDKITGDVYYINNNLECSMQEYVVFNDVEYTLVNPPTLVREGMVSDNSELKGMSKYSFEFYHPMYMLGNLPFTDVAVSYDELRYKSQDKTFSWIGKPADFVAKLNKNLERTEWVVVMSDRFPQDKEDELSDVLSFDNNTIADVLKTGYETWGVPYVVDKLQEGEYYHTDANNNDVDYYTQGKRFVVVFGLPSNEIYESDSARQNNTPFVFRFGQGVGLKNNSRTPRNNKIVTRIAGYGSERNIPYGYPQVRWYGDPTATCTIGDSVGAKQNVTINGTTYDWAMSYPIYDGIVGGEWVKLIKHPFTRKHLMPTVYANGVFNKVSQFLSDGTANPNFDPDIEIKDYYDAVANDTGYDYTNLINPLAPSYEIHEFEDIYPELGSYNILGATPINADLTNADGWDDTMDDNGNYLQSYFKITLPQLEFDIYACAAITEEMEINMRSGACIGCTFTVQVDWDDYKRNFYDSDMNFAPNGNQRDFTKYPDSSQGSITVIVQKDINTFGTIMPNIYQNPHAGDAFVVLGISLPLSYITSGQTRLDAAMKSYMLENNIHYFDYPLKFDEYFLANNTNILNQIRPNSIIRFAFNNENLELFVKQLTIKFNESTLPQYDITLTDNVEVVLNQIGQVADDVEHLGTLIALLRQQYNRNVWVELSKKLSKVNDDTAQGLISFAQGWQTQGFFSNNFIGNGAKVDQYGVGEFEEVNVRGALRAAELVFNQIRAEGGERIESIGYGEIETATPSTMVLGMPKTGTATLKLDGDEWATIDVGDICRGVYNTIGDDDLYDDSLSNEGLDDNGFRTQRGFFSSYFKITNIITNQKGYCEFTYQLQVVGKSASQAILYNDVAICPHPCPLMKFAVYGNINSNKKARQSCIYTTAVGIAPRQLYLAGVNDWNIKPENIKIAKGNIEGINVWEEVSETEYNNYDGTVGVNKKTWDTTIDGSTVHHYAVIKELHGDAGFYCEDNIYLGGIIDQFKSAAMDVVNSQISNLGQAWVSVNMDKYVVDCDEDGYPFSNDSFTITASLFFGNEGCVLDTSDSQFIGHGNSTTPTFSNNNKTASKSYTIDSSETFASENIIINLKGTYNNNTYIASKTVSIVANRQGTSGTNGTNGSSVAFVETNEEYFIVECNNDGEASAQVSLPLRSKLRVGNEYAYLSSANCSYTADDTPISNLQFETDGTGYVLVKKNILISSGFAPYQKITISLNGSLNGTTYTASKAVYIIANKQGADGANGSAGRGISSVTTYYKRSTEYEGVTAPATNVNTNDITNAGWVSSYIEPTEDEPYLWRFTRTTYTKAPTTSHTPAELIKVYSDLSNPNLLADTDFIEGKLDGWEKMGDVSEADASLQFGISTSHYQGHNAYYAIGSINDDGTITMLSQCLYRNDGVSRIEPNKWYTLSFVAESGQSQSGYVRVYMPAIDTTNGVKMYVNGTEVQSAESYLVELSSHNTANVSITFKTISSFANNVGYSCIWDLTYSSGSTNNEIYICVPKLEVGKVATPYVPMRSVTEPMARASTWVAGKQYYQGDSGEPYMDMVSVGTAWYRCTRSHVSTNSNKPVAATTTTYWQPANNFSFIATDLLLADQAVINLMFSQKILMQNNLGQLTASINNDGQGSYCIYYPSGNRRIEFSYDGFIRYFNDDDGSLAWTLGHGGDITKGSSDDWALLPLHKLTNSEMTNLSSSTDFSNSMTNYWQFHSGSGGNYSQADGIIYTSKPASRNPNNATMISNGSYTPNMTPYQELVNDDAKPAITVYTISSGKITSTTTLIGN